MMKLKRKNDPKSQIQIAVLSENVTEDKFERLIEADSGDLGTLVTKSDEIQSRCTDVEDVAMSDVRIDGRLHLVLKDGGDIGITPYAFSQLCTKLGIPTQYMKRCIEVGYSSLVVESINEWLYYYGHKKLLIRKYDEVARGILSNKYSVCDTPEILSSISESGILSDMDLKSYVINPSRFHARFVGEKMNVAGEDLFAGIQIDSSDVGRSKLDIKFLIYKQVCTNGLILPKEAGTIYEQKHIGISSEKMVESLKESFNNFSLQVSNASSLIEKAKEIPIRDVDHVLGQIKIGAKIGEDTANDVFTVASEHYSMTAWGIVNALTEVSQNYTLEHRIGMERYAGVLLTNLLKAG